MLSARQQAQWALAFTFTLCAPFWLLAGKRSKPKGPFAIHAQSQLVNLTITATNAQGKPFRGLKASDVVVRDDGNAQTLLNFRPAVTQTSRTSSVSTVASPSRSARPAAPPENPDYIAFVMDDSTTSYVDLRQSILAAAKWVKEDMSPDDRVGLLSISYGVQVWQPFTSDRDLLLQKLNAMLHERPAEGLNERIDDLLREPDFPCSPRAGLGPPGPITGGSATGNSGPNDGTGTSDTRAASDIAEDKLADMWTQEEQPRIPDQFNWLRALVDMMGVFPGQKRVIYLGDGFLMNPRRFAAYVFAAYCGGRINFGLSTYPFTLHSVIDAATRAGVTFYTIDARGLTAEPMFGEAAENISPPINTATGSNAANVQAFYTEKLRAPEDALNELADGTGGIAYNNGNDLTYFIQRAVNSIEGTYYASYQPADISLNGLYHKIAIRSLLPGVKVRTRGGYYARPVREFPVRAEVMKMMKKGTSRYFVRVKFILSPSTLRWHGFGSHRNDELTVSHRLENSRGRLITSRVQMFEFLRPRSGRLSFEIGWNLPPGVYKGTLEVTEQDTSNFGSASFGVNVP